MAAIRHGREMLPPDVAEQVRPGKRVFRLPVPAGYRAEKVAGGRVGATRWAIFREAEWIGDVVRWKPENTWSAQPAEGEDWTDYRTPEDALAALTRS